MPSRTSVNRVHLTNMLLKETIKPQTLQPGSQALLLDLGWKHLLEAAGPSEPKQ